MMIVVTPLSSPNCTSVTTFYGQSDQISDDLQPLVTNFVTKDVVKIFSDNSDFVTY